MEVSREINALKHNNVRAHIISRYVAHQSDLIVECGKLTQEFLILAIRVLKPSENRKETCRTGVTRTQVLHVVSKLNQTLYSLSKHDNKPKSKKTETIAKEKSQSKYLT